MCLIPNASGNGMMICGSKAAKKIFFLAKEALAVSQFSDRVDLQEVYREIQRILAKKLLFPNLDEVNIELIETTLASVVKTASKKCADRTHLLPCNLIQEDEDRNSPTIIVIGPVTFRRTTKLIEDLEPLFDAYVQASENSNISEKKEYRKNQSEIAASYYRKFGWIARVDVQGCDPAVSYRKARAAVSSAVDGLHVLLGDFSEKFQMEGQPSSGSDHRAKLAVESGSLRVSVSTHFHHERGVDDLSNFFAGEDKKELLNLIGLTVASQMNSILSRPLCNRLTDASSWYGKGIRERDDAMRIIQFVTALERLVVTSEVANNKITEKFRSRVGALCSGRSAYFNVEDAIRTAYTLRSKLVHGYISQFSQNLEATSYRLSLLCRWAIGSAYLSFGREMLVSDKVKDKHVSEWYENLIEAIR